MGQVRESLGWFHNALNKMSCSLPTGRLHGGITLLGQSIRQYLHVKFPSHFIGHVLDSDGFLDKARCMTHMVHAYHIMNRKRFSLIPALKLLNIAEEARCFCVHEVSRRTTVCCTYILTLLVLLLFPQLVEAYTCVVECCQLLNYRQLADHYFNAAIT